jgi:pyruvate dehydrogenase E2 component (dihydrolipoamide acetyltransferase)
VAIEVLLPKLGLTMESGLIEEWLVSAGTLVQPGEPLMRLATDKVEVDVEAEAEGLFHPAVAQGSELPPGALVGWLLAEGEAVPATSAAAPAAPTAAPQAAETVVSPSGALTAPIRTGRQFVSPNARRVARERGVDVSQLRGTGPGGRVITADVIDAPEQPAVAAPAARGGVVSPLVRRDAVAAGVDLGSVPAGPGGKIRRAD